MKITASGNDDSIRFGCLDVLVYPEDPDPGYGEAVCQSVGGTHNVQVYTDQFSEPFFSLNDGVVTFIPGVYRLLCERLAESANCGAGSAALPTLRGFVVRLRPPNRIQIREFVCANLLPALR